MKLLRLVCAIALLLVLGTGLGEAYQCGDLNGSGQLDVSDLIFLVGHMFQGGPPIPYPPAADCNGDTTVDISDLVCWVDWMFGGGQWPPACPMTVLTNTSATSGGCLADSVTKKSAVGKALSKGQLQVEVSGYDLHVHHLGAFYNCCLEYHVHWHLSAGVLTGFESDLGALCDCYCTFDLHSTLNGLQAGEYLVVLIGIEMDTIGTATVTIPGGATVVEYGDTGCLDLVSPPKTPVIDYTYSSDTLLMVHQNASFNCGGIIAVQFEQAGDTLRFFEINVSDEWMYCMCYFGVWAQLVDIVSGDYIAEVYARDYPDDPIVLIDRRPLTLED